jgi:hypothetical protein
MQTALIADLLAFLLSPIGLVCAAVGLFLVFQARRVPRAGWLLYALCTLAASMGKPGGPYILVVPPLAFPLEQLRDVGRPLSLLLIGLLLLLGLQQARGWRRALLPPPLRYLLAVQAVIILKTLLYGSISFALLTILTLGAVILMLVLGPARRLQTRQDFDRGVWAIAMVGVLFLGAVLYQAWFDLYPMTFLHSRLIGLTANPQMAAGLLSPTIPALLYMAESRAHLRAPRLFWLLALLFVTIALLLTGSRTGLLMALTTLFFFYRARLGQAAQLAVALAIIATLLLAFPPLRAILESFLDPVQTRYTNLENTRQDVWSALWRSFLAYPLLGVPLRGDRLFGYGESSWLGAAASLGLLGFIPLLLFGGSSLRMLWQLHRLGQTQTAPALPTRAIIAGIAAIFVGSVFEAFLLGNLSSSLLLLFIYLTLGHYLQEAQARVVPLTPAAAVPPRHRRRRVLPPSRVASPHPIQP